jgi:hypothetical protein
MNNTLATKAPRHEEDLIAFSCLRSVEFQPAAEDLDRLMNNTLATKAPRREEDLTAFSCLRVFVVAS